MDEDGDANVGAEGICTQFERIFVCVKFVSSTTRSWHPYLFPCVFYAFYFFSSNNFVTFNWKDNENNNLNFDNDSYLHVIQVQIYLFGFRPLELPQSASHFVLISEKWHHMPAPKLISIPHRLSMIVQKFTEFDQVAFMST